MKVIVPIIAMILSTKVNHLTLMIFVMFVDLEIFRGIRFYGILAS